MTRKPLNTARHAAMLWLSVVCQAALAQGEPQPRPQRPDWEGAVGLLPGWGPAFMGSSELKLRASLGFFVRYRRWSFSNNAGGFVTRQDADVIRGIGVELGHREDLRVNLGLRYDSGRRESSSEQLKGLGNVPHTIRARLAATWQLEPRWKLGAAWTVDAFGRGGGNFGELSLRHERDLSPQLHVYAGTSVSLAGDRYLQTYFGVTPEQSARSGYPVYNPGMGLRDASLFAGMRYRLHRDWVVLGGAGVSRLLGSAADSPLALRRSSYSINGGLAWRF